MRKGKRDLPGGDVDVDEDVVPGGGHPQLVGRQHDLPDGIRRGAEDDH